MVMARKELCQLNYIAASSHDAGKKFTLPWGVIHFALCRTRFRAGLTPVRNLFQDDFPQKLLENRLQNYKLKVIDMQITITLGNNHHAKRVFCLFIY